MAIYKEHILDVDLSGRNALRDYKTVRICRSDQGADRIGVRVFRNGKPESLSGCSCKWYFHNSRGDTAIESSGTVSGNTAYITLPASCYACAGKFTLDIKITGGNINSTVRTVDGIVDESFTD